MPPEYSSEGPVSRPSLTVSIDEEKRRLHSRIPANARLQLQWHDVRAGQRQMPARAVNASKVGALVEVERPIPTGTILVIYTTQGLVVGRGNVRHCTPKGMNYLIGLYLPERLARAF
jgi:hypothetical protein